MCRYIHIWMCLNCPVVGICVAIMAYNYRTHISPPVCIEYIGNLSKGVIVIEDRVAVAAPHRCAFLDKLIKR